MVTPFQENVNEECSGCRLDASHVLQTVGHSDKLKTMCHVFAFCVTFFMQYAIFRNIFGGGWSAIPTSPQERMERHCSLVTLRG